MRVETTSKEFARIVNGKEISSDRPKTVIKGSREIVILADVMKKRDLFLKIVKDFECDIDVDIKVFISPTCPSCPHVVEEVSSIPARRIEIIDVTEYPEMAEMYDITSVPTVLIGDVKLIGKVDRHEVLRWIECDRREYFAKLLRDGRIEEVIKDVKEKRDANLLVDLLTYKDFIVRLGSMVAIEEIAKENPEIVEGVKGRIRKLLKHDDYRIRQDTAMLLGEIGSYEDLEFIEEILRESFDESLVEAIEEIKKRMR